MSKIWIFVLCVVLNSIPVIPKPKIPVAKWPSLIKSPTVPRLEDLKLAIRDLTSKPRAVPDFSTLIITNTDINKDRNDCEKNEVELHAEEFKSSNNDTTYKNETTSAEKETELEIQNKNFNKKQSESNNETSSDIKPLPTFIPIFRKRKPKKVKTSTPVKLKNENSSAKVQNIKHDNDLVINYVKNSDDTPILNKPGLQNAIDKGIVRIIPINTMFPYGFPSSVITSYSQLSNEAPNNVAPVNLQSPSDGLTNIFPSKDAPTNTVQENVLPVETIPQNDVPANSTPTTRTKTRNFILLKTIANNPEYANVAPADAVHNIDIIPTNIFSTNAKPDDNMDVKNSDPGNDFSGKLFPLNNIDMNSFMINTKFPNNIVPENSIPINMLPSPFITDNNVPVNNANFVRIKMIPVNTFTTNTIPEDTVPVNTVPKYSVPVNTAPENDIHIITTPANAVPTNTAPANTAHKHTIAKNSANPTNTIPANSIIIKTASTANTVPSSIVPLNIAPKEAMHLDKLPTILTNGIMNGVPRNIDSSNTMPLRNTIPLSNTNPANTLPIKTGCNECGKCSDNGQQADLVLFKPEEVSVLNVCGDILKKVTMTVLVPMYVSKLDL